MGCGSSSQPIEEQTLKDVPGKLVDHVDSVEPFNTKTPSPELGKEGRKEKLSDGPMPQPSAFVVSTSPTVEPVEDLGEVSVSSLGTPISNTAEEFNNASPVRGVAVSPGYKLENDTKKIGKFDPEAFRKANFKGGGNQAVSPTTHQPLPYQSQGDSWAQPANNGGGGGGGGFDHHDNGYSNTGGDRWQASSDYIQSEDIFSSSSPQAMQGTSNMNFRDDPASDPFRAAGGLGHVPSDPMKSKLITDQDDALMDDILGELDDV